MKWCDLPHRCALRIQQNENITWKCKGTRKKAGISYTPENSRAFKNNRFASWSVCEPWICVKERLLKIGTGRHFREQSVVKSAHCFFRGSRFSSQYPHGSWQPLSLDFMGTRLAYSAHTYMQAKHSFTYFLGKRKRGWKIQDCTQYNLLRFTNRNVVKVYSKITWRPTICVRKRSIYLMTSS